jgi:hypothetical protein
MVTKQVRIINDREDHGRLKPTDFIPAAWAEISPWQKQAKDDFKNFGPALSLALVERTNESSGRSYRYRIQYKFGTILLHVVFDEQNKIAVWKAAARHLRHPVVTSEHLFYACLRLHDQRHWEICRNLPVTAEIVWSHLQQHVPSEISEDFCGVPLGISAKVAFERAETEACNAITKRLAQKASFGRSYPRALAQFVHFSMSIELLRVHMDAPNPALNRTAAGESVPDSYGSVRRCRLVWR